MIASHVFGFQLSRGLLQPDPGTGRLPVIRHRCDEASCHNPAHWLGGTHGDNSADYAARGSVAGSPLTDRRGPGGRARAIRDAILAALAAGGGPADIEAAIWSASAAGIVGARDDLDPGEAIRECVGELGKLHTDYQRAQVYATLALREAVAEVAKQIRLASRR